MKICKVANKILSLAGLCLFSLMLVPFSKAQSQVPLPNQVDWAWQGWTEQQRDFYHFAPQGTYLTQTDWFLALERPDSELLISDPFYLAGLGFMIEPKSPANPLGLPVGFAQGRSPGGNMISTQGSIGLTCSACHSGQIIYRGKSLRFDGLGAITNISGFESDISNSIVQTYNDPAKWLRFSRRVLGAGFNTSSDEQLRTQFSAQVNKIMWAKNNVNPAVIYPVTAGYGRTDAIGDIGNNVFGADLQDPSNYHVADANVSFPFLWGIWRFDWVQYDASVTQPMQRNVGETLGVGALTNYLTDGMPTSLPAKYKSSVDIYNLAQIETTLQSLKAPSWPKDLFGEFNTSLALEGRSLFNSQCGKCHGPTPIVKPGNNYQELAAYIMPLSQINTDPLRTSNASSARFNPSKLLGIPNSPSINLDKGLDLVTEGAKQYFYTQQGLNISQQSILNGNRLPITDFEQLRYKARTLEGVWATAPYLHNGSVRNIYELLSPVEERSTKFWVGLNDYDPLFLGVGTKQNELGFWMDTSIAGNSNTGHEFRDGNGPGIIGRRLSNSEKMAIIEYLKAIDVIPPDQQPAKWAPHRQ